VRLARIVAFVVVAAVAGVALHGLTWQRFRCDVKKKRLQAVALELLEAPSQMAVARLARQGLFDAEHCVAVNPADVDMYMTLAIYYRLTGRIGEAAATYGAALQYDRRPELYLNLGEMQVLLGERETATATLTRAASFDPLLVDRISDPVIRETVRSTVAGLH
jgi:cytochrome c-type biogenesis protein CcmH/NrfG